MRTREEIEEITKDDLSVSWQKAQIQFELLLDIRDLLIKMEAKKGVGE